MEAARGRGQERLGIPFPNASALGEMKVSFPCRLALMTHAAQTA